MGHKVEEGYGIEEILRAGYGMKISWWDRDALISIEIVSGIRYFKSR